MSAKLVTYNSQNYAGTLGSGLQYTIYLMAFPHELTLLVCINIE